MLLRMLLRGTLQDPSSRNAVKSVSRSKVPSPSAWDPRITYGSTLSELAALEGQACRSC